MEKDTGSPEEFLINQQFVIAYAYLNVIVYFTVFFFLVVGCGF